MYTVLLAWQLFLAWYLVLFLDLFRKLVNAQNSHIIMIMKNWTQWRILFISQMDSPCIKQLCAKHRGKYFVA